MSYSNKIVFGLTLISRIWSALIGLLLVPIYVKILGPESYGLVAFYATLSSSLAILDLGIGTAISRQVAILFNKTDQKKKLDDLVLTVEYIYLGISILTGLAIILLSYPIAKHWIISTILSSESIENSVTLMGLVFMTQFPSGIYSGILVGTNNLVFLAINNLIFSTLKALGVLFVLYYVSPTIQVYFIWQVIITLISTVILRYFAIKYLQLKDATFDLKQLKSIGNFAAGVTGISLITFFITQVDKIILSKYVMIEQLGYYSLGFSVAGLLQQLISPLQPIFFPQLSKLASIKHDDEMVAIYFKGCKIIAIIVSPFAAFLVFFSSKILYIWTQNQLLTDSTSKLVIIITLGTFFNSLVLMSYWYMLAKGITKFSMYQNIISALLSVPLLIWSVNNHGVVGAAYVWLLINLGYLLVSLPIFHMLYLKGRINEFFKNVAYPIFLAFFIAMILKNFASLDDKGLIAFIIISIFAGLIYVLMIPTSRLYLTRNLPWIN